MQLILVRHALAQDRDDFASKGGKEDSLRPLTFKGRKKMLKMARHLRLWFDDVDLIVSSPYIRALQTAEILSRSFRRKITEASELVPHSSPELFVRWLKSLKEDPQRVVIVGHEPQLSLFATYLLVGSQMHPLFQLKKSGALCLGLKSLHDIAPASAELLWLIPPKLVVS